jgi:hypothetical protein
MRTLIREIKQGSGGNLDADSSNGTPADARPDR